MSYFALAILGLIFGWSLCRLCLSADRPKLPSRPKFLWFLLDPRWPRTPDPIALFRAQKRQRAFNDEASALSKRRLKLVQYWFAVSIFCAAAFLIAIELLQNFRSPPAASIEYFITEPRVAILSLMSTIGFAIRLYRRPLLSGLDTFSKIALVSGNSPKEKSGDKKKTESVGENASNTAINYVDSRFPWYVEIGILVSVVIVVVVWINPQLLKNLTSFKAGGVEAHFATASGSATVQSGLIVNVDPARKTISQAWAQFTYPNKKDARYDTYQDEGVKEVRTEVENEMTNASVFFESYIKPAFVYETGIDTKTTPARSEIDDNLKKLVLQLSHLVRDGGKDVDYRSKNINKILSELCEYSFVANDEKKTAFSFKDSIDPRYLALTRWDPYVIQAVGDLLLVLDKKREQEDFFVAASRGEADEGICPKGCRTAGQLSLMYDLILAKVRSARPWPFEETLKQLSETLDGVDAVLDRNEARWARNQSAPQSGIDCLCEKTNSLFRRNRFMDLTLGLELFYQRNLQGQHFSPSQLQTWRDWLTETRAVVDTLDDGIAAWPPPFSDDVRKSWIRARSDLRSRPDMLEDAYVGIALSIVLIGSIDGDVSERDCNAAHGFLVRADDALPHYVKSAHLDADDKETYQGFLEEVKMSVDGRCRQ